jgi:energy-coupling factor transporter ATP-binding protein EcfA2
MAMHLRKLQLKITTMRGLFGVNLEFDASGLNVIRAHNTSGKSTCVQALVYCLGLEAMLTTNRSAPPLQYALLEKFQFQDEEIAVDESEVLVELENGQGRTITVRRPIVSHSERTNLIYVWEGPHLTEPASVFTKESYFVRLEGAAQRERGFHTFLAAFLGWDLPLVPKFDGSEVPLYLECLFPLFIVEQKHGWSGIQSRMPTHFGIREMAKRATEFTMRLDSYTIAAERQRLKESILLLERRWEQNISDVSAKLGVLGGLPRRLPKTPTLHWPPVPSVECLAFNGKEWQAVSVASSMAKDRLAVLDARPIATAGEDAARNAEQLKIVQRELSVLEVLASSVSRDVETEAEQIESLDRRIEALSTDLQNYQDIRRLRQIGASVALSIANGRCPTCDQNVEDALLPQSSSTVPMSLDENINFIEGQIRAFASMRRDSDRVLDSKQRSLEGIRTKMQELRSSIRAYKQALTSSGQDASAGMVRERMVLEDNLQKYGLMSTIIEEATVILETLATEYKGLTERLDGLSGAISPEDETKLRELDASFVSQLEEYGFSSIRPPSLLSISRESYRPTYEGFDLGFNLSASDMIRTIWAYLYGLLEVSRISQTNHPGLLILDEPRQQQANRLSFALFATRAAASRQANQQVIFLTSEDEDTVQEMLGSVEHKYINFAGQMKLIQPMASEADLVN